MCARVGPDHLLDAVKAEQLTRIIPRLNDTIGDEGKHIALLQVRLDGSVRKPGEGAKGQSARHLQFSMVDVGSQMSRIRREQRARPHEQRQRHRGASAV